MCSHEAKIKMYHPKPVRKLAADQLGIFAQEKIKFYSAILPKSKESSELSKTVKPTHFSQMITSSDKTRSRKTYVDGAKSRLGLDFGTLGNDPSSERKELNKTTAAQGCPQELPLTKQVDFLGSAMKREADDKVATQESSTKNSVGGLDTEADDRAANTQKRALITRCKNPLYNVISTNKNSNLKDSTWLAHDLDISGDSLDSNDEEHPSGIKGQDPKSPLQMA